MQKVPLLPLQQKPINIQFKTAYGPKLKITLNTPSGEGRTKQSFKDECDINVIMRRYEQTGVLEHTEKRKALYADVTGRDYQHAMDTIAEARTAFAELPARIRDRFDNDPIALLDFIHDPDNRGEAAELGFLSAEALAALAEEAKAALEPRGAGELEDPREPRRHYMEPGRRAGDETPTASSPASRGGPEAPRRETKPR